MAGATAADPISTSLLLLHDVSRLSAAGFTSPFRRDCTDLSRRVSLLSHLLEEIRDNLSNCEAPSSFPSLDELAEAIKEVKKVVLAAGKFEFGGSSDMAHKKIGFQFQCVTWKLEKTLGKLPLDQFDISEEVQEQVELVRAQLTRASEKYGGPLSSVVLSRVSSEPLLDKEFDPQPLSHRIIGSLHIKNTGNIDHEVSVKMGSSPNGNDSQRYIQMDICEQKGTEINETLNTDSSKLEENKKPDSPVIPDDFLCPISLELMKDPVIVATGQTYERTYIQRWIDGGNTTCPKTRQKLQNFVLTPNYVLRSLIAQWCSDHNIEQPMISTNMRIKKSDGSFRDVSMDLAAIESLVRKLSSRSIEERRGSVFEIRSLSKRNTDNRILIAEAGAIPILINLLTSDDNLTQENAVTSILNLSIYEHNKGLIMLANAIPSIVQVLRSGTVEARENAAATLFSLSLLDENKIIIGASGAIPALVELLQNGSSRGRKDAATALYRLCIYQGNKGRAVRAGIISALLKMLTDVNNSMVDEALTILSVLVSNHEAKAAIVKASTIPILIDLVRTGLPRNKENSAAILLSLCKRDTENLVCISRLGAVIPLTELASNGTDRAKRKANSLLEHLRKLQLL